MAAGVQGLLDLGLVLVWAIGLPGVLIGLLNRRDRRDAAILGMVASAVGSEAMRTSVAAEVRSAILTGRTRVRVDLGLSSREEVWEAIGRLRQSLPPSVRLEVDGPIDHRGSARIRVEALARASLGPARP